MTIHLTNGSGGVLELHVHDGAHVTFSDALEIVPTERLFEAPRLAKPEQLTGGSKLSRWFLPVAACVVGIVVGFALSPRTILPGVASPSAVAMRGDPVPRSVPQLIPGPLVDQPTAAAAYPHTPIPTLPAQRAEGDGPVALPPAIAQQLAQPALVTPAPLPSAALLKRNGNAFGLED